MSQMVNHYKADTKCLNNTHLLIKYYYKNIHNRTSGKFGWYRIKGIIEIRF